MLRISKIVDYGILVLSHMARHATDVCSAAELAASLNLGPATVSKVLKLLAQHELVLSIRGARGGYRLGRMPQDINVAQIIDALEEQPFGLTECTAVPGVCSVEDACHIRPHWLRINNIVRQTLESVSLADMQADVELLDHRPESGSGRTATVKFINTAPNPTWSIPK